MRFRNFVGGVAGSGESRRASDGRRRRKLPGSEPGLANFSAGSQGPGEEHPELPAEDGRHDAVHEEVEGGAEGEEQLRDDAQDENPERKP